MTAHSPLSNQAYDDLIRRGMHPDIAQTRIELLSQVLPPDAGEEVRIWWVPGRIELLGKHTDYAGGRSLLAATHRGIWFAVRPRSDRRFCAHDLVSDEAVEFDLSADLTPLSGWGNYPSTVGRRLGRNFGSLRGADFYFGSDLPLAAGLSSSSALIVGFSLGLIATNRLDHKPAYTDEIRDPLDLSGYLGTIENGQSFGALQGDKGVGTFGGSEDHTAILTCRGGHLEQYAFCPIRHERTVPFPDALVIAIGASGVVAEKTGAAMDLYNRASRLASAVLDATRRNLGGDWPTLAEAVREMGEEPIRVALGASGSGEFSSEELAVRFEHFVVESEQLVAGAADAMVENDLDAFGRRVAESQSRGARLLANQVDETEKLCEIALEEGAIASSAFGAGFGGSVWAAVCKKAAPDFLDRWRTRYSATFPARIDASMFFLTFPSPGAFEVSGQN